MVTNLLWRMSAERSPSLCQLRNVLSSTKASNKVWFSVLFSLAFSSGKFIIRICFPLWQQKRTAIFFSIVQHFQFLSTYKGKVAQPVNSQGASNEISFHHGKQFVKLFVWIPNNHRVKLVTSFILPNSGYAPLLGKLVTTPNYDSMAQTRKAFLWSVVDSVLKEDNLLREMAPMNNTFSANVSIDVKPGLSLKALSRPEGIAWCAVFSLVSFFIAVVNLLIIFLFSANKRVRQKKFVSRD